MAPNVHKKLPPSVLAKIARFTADNRIEDLKNFIRVGPDLKNVALSNEALYHLCVEYRHDFAWWSGTNSWYYGLFIKLVGAKNSYALYIESIRLAFNVGEIDVALYLLDDVKDIHPHAKLMFIMLCFCAGRECLKVYLMFQAHFKFAEVEWMGKELMYHIDAVNSRKADTYRKTWKLDYCPECWDMHAWLGENNGERCNDCVYFYLSRDICRML
ncbi:unnamed protein product [Arabis nemorensis]|uniref:Uncharacterized protein n=1 Tax=Arabis nemorensis TaxID=586526 RepID=A0A565B067_9BRAS|nr:unnamed protein product [Arabis nemorensis]